MKKSIFHTIFAKMHGKSPLSRRAHQVLFQASQFVGEHPPLYKKTLNATIFPRYLTKKTPVGEYIRRTPWN
ncbi:hypothetical protein G5A01_00765 [Blautia faecis]|uniref:hypothetical protein n=1 Tax=Blautia faecis TaxID=871665 RepID=UPI00156F8FDA|nr:hypothetical protein [Blautia faecis]NSG91520.1 hypothetical protein [Blautia faecis]